MIMIIIFIRIILRIIRVIINNTLIMNNDNNNADVGLVRTLERVENRRGIPCLKLVRLHAYWLGSVIEDDVLSTYHIPIIIP